MLTAEFDFQLPPELIAQTPRERAASRLLVLPRNAAPEHRRIRSLPEILSPGDLVVVNNTRVLAARIFGQLQTGGRMELLLVEPHRADEWDCLVKPGRKARPGTQIDFGNGLGATVLQRGDDGRFRLRFSSPPEEHLAAIGHVPLPPYIRRPDNESDRESYQTVFASIPGAIAAPTAGLHFDRGLLSALRDRDIGLAELTLHVGVGTFKPVTADLVHEHSMDAEQFHLPADCAQAIAETRRRGGRIVAVGTTVVRTLETVAAREGEPISEAIGATDLFITPGFQFRLVDLLLTNFHLPRSTLLMLVSAFAGRRRVLDAYAEAIRRRYRFYSYGDAMLVEHDPHAR